MPDLPDVVAAILGRMMAKQPADRYQSPEELVQELVSAAGTHHQATEEELRRMIRDAGFVPKQRDTLYRTYFLN